MSVNAQTNQLSVWKDMSVVNIAKYCIFGYILTQELISNGLLTEEILSDNSPDALEIVLRGVQSYCIKMPECEFEEIGAAKYSIFGYIVIQELISQGALTDESVGEAYTEVRPANCGNENSVLKIVIQGMDIFKMPELD